VSAAGPFKVTHPMKRFCSERCKRASDKDRYRARHRETATCKRCGASFERVVVGRRLKVFCSKSCQYEAKSESMRRRPDIRLRLARARAAQKVERGRDRGGMSFA
jgi:hypothetical protein